MDKSMEKALETLKNSGVIVTPTETVLGISCSALDSDIIERVYKIKNRPSSKALIVLVDSLEMITQYVPNIGDTETSYLNAERPTTVILSNIKGLPNNLIADDGSLAFRITKRPELLEIISKLGFPIVSTSANLSGEPTAKNIKELSPVILEQVDYVLDLQSSYQSSSKPSRIVKIEGDEVNIIRN